MYQSYGILVVEDDPADYLLLKRGITEADNTISLFWVSDGIEALAFLRGQPPYTDTATRPNLILMDIKMPRVNGLELIATVKADPDLRSIPIVVLTASDDTNDIACCFRYSVAGYFVKPLSIADLIRIIQVFTAYWSLSKLPEKRVC